MTNAHKIYKIHTHHKPGIKNKIKSYTHNHTDINQSINQNKFV